MKKRIKQFLKIAQFLITKPKEFIVAGYDRAIFNEKKNYVFRKYGFKKGLPVFDILGEKKEIFKKINP